MEAADHVLILVEPTVAGVTLHSFFSFPKTIDGAMGKVRRCDQAVGQWLPLPVP